jgi:putative transposase
MSLNSLSTSGSIKALKMAVKYRKYKTEELIHHSDRGLQYCSNDYQNILYQNNIKCSMTESYNPYANAVAERVNGILKQEFIGDNNNLKLPIMKALVSDSIKIYNHKRPHYSCYMKTPETMHQQRQV